MLSKKDRDRVDVPYFASRLTGKTVLTVRMRSASGQSGGSGDTFELEFSDGTILQLHGSAAKWGGPQGNHMSQISVEIEERYSHYRVACECGQEHLLSRDYSLEGPRRFEDCCFNCPINGKIQRLPDAIRSLDIPSLPMPEGSIPLYGVPPKNGL